MMRIITGTARGVHLATLEGLATRPTAERIKEAFFSMIQFDIVGRNVLDLFAGSGQLGLEALSRGAEKAVFVDKSLEALAVIKANAQKSKLFDRSRIVNYDYKDYIRTVSKQEKFDLIFIDPPYAEKIIPDVIHRLIEQDCIAENALFICESEDESVYERNGLELVKHTRYGKTYITILRKIGSEKDASGVVAGEL